MTDSEAHRIIAEHRRVWKKKPVLRSIYAREFFARLVSACKPGGVSVEVGGGPGFLKEMWPEVISTDLIRCPWLDLVADAQLLPFRSESICNLLGLDVLHHLENPLAFLKEAERVLMNQGRLILVEPWITPFSYLVYRYLHQEDCDLTVDVLKPKQERAAQKRPFDGNAALPYLLFRPNALEATRAALPRLVPVIVERFCLFAYLLSCGFKRLCFLPAPFYPLTQQLERTTLPLWRSLAALRVLLVLEKSAGRHSEVGIERC